MMLVTLFLWLVFGIAVLATGHIFISVIFTGITVVLVVLLIRDDHSKYKTLR